MCLITNNAQTDYLPKIVLKMMFLFTRTSPDPHLRGRSGEIEKKRDVKNTALSLLRQLELLGKHRLALLVLVRGPGFREDDAARSFLRQQLPHSLPRRDQQHEYDEALKAVYQVRRYPGQGEKSLLIN